MGEYYNTHWAGGLCYIEYMNSNTKWSLKSKVLTMEQAAQVEQFEAEHKEKLYNFLRGFANDGSNH